MGLDFVEFVMSVEERFGIAIPDEDAQNLTTPRRLVDYIMTRVKSGTDRGCLGQREFYHLRRALIARHWVTRGDLKSETQLEGIVPKLNRRMLWRQLGEEFQSSHWPHLTRPRPLKAVLTATAAIAFLLPWILRAGDILKGHLTPVAFSVLFTIAVVWMGLVATKRWQEAFPPHIASVGGVVHSLMATNYLPVQEGWTRQEVREIVRAMITEQFAVTDFTDDASFGQDIRFQ